MNLTVLSVAAHSPTVKLELYIGLGYISSYIMGTQ